jgi:hypothetical protein
MLQSRGFPKEGYLFVSFRGEQLGVRGINDMLKGVAKKGFNGKAKLWKTKHLRDAFMSGLRSAKIPQELKDAMVGHKRQGARNDYAITEQEILIVYKDAFKFLTINGYGSQSRKLEELERTFNRKSEEQNQEIKALRTVLLSLISREKLEALVTENLKKTPETVKVRFGEAPQRTIKDLTDKELLELYYQTL